MKALLFAEGGPDIGLGHLRRSSALAHAFSRRGWDCRFVVSDPRVRDWLSAKICDVIHGRRSGPSSLPEADYSSDLLIVDSYSVSNQDIQEKTAGTCRSVLAFDDLQNRSPAADIILSTGIGADGVAWPDRERRLHLLGPKFHPLPPEFFPLRKRSLSESVSTVLISFGGSDSGDLALRAARTVRRVFPQARIDIVSSPFAPIQGSVRGLDGARILDGNEPMAACYLDADIAVTGAGQTVLEIAATGTPAVAVALAGNQAQNLADAAGAGLVLSASLDVEPGSARSLESALGELRSPVLRRALSETGQRVIDGRGGERVAEAARKFLEIGRVPR